MKQDPNEPILANIRRPTDFVSPFPSEDVLVSERFKAFNEGDAKKPTAAMAAYQAGVAWADVMQIGMKQKAVFQGFRSQVWSDIAEFTDGIPHGLFAQVAVPNSDDPKVMMEAFAQTGFNVAVNVLSATPIAGPILDAVVSVGRFVAGLFQKDKKEAEDKVPMAKFMPYSKDVDTELARVILQQYMPSTDWTNTFLPALDSGSGFRLQSAKDGDREGYIWGSFGGGSSPEPDWSGGLGFMPGSQKMADTIQFTTVKEETGLLIEELVNVGNFFPATAQMGTAMWEQVQKIGSPDMFNVKAQLLYNEWSTYFNDMFGEAAQQWEAGDQFTQMRISRAVQQFIMAHIPSTGWSGSLDILGVEDYLNMLWWPGMFDCGNEIEGCKFSVGEGKTWGPTPPLYRSHTNPKSHFRDYTWSRVDKSVILPQLRTLKNRQWAALYDTTVCAYVVPDGPNANAAFKDGTWGQQLADRCRRARDHLVGSAGGGIGSGYDIRYRIRLKDVRDIDPVFAQRLEQSGVDENSWMMGPVTEIAGNPRPTWDPDSKPPPPPIPPVGGVAFQASPLEPSGGGGGKGILLAAAALGIFAAMRRKR
jgi:hypothetical protein